MSHIYDSLQIYEGLERLGYPRQQVEIETQARRLYLGEKKGNQRDRKVPERNLNALLLKLNVPINGKDLARNMDMFSETF